MPDARPSGDASSGIVTASPAGTSMHPDSPGSGAPSCVMVIVPAPSGSSGTDTSPNQTQPGAEPPSSTSEVSVAPSPVSEGISKLPGANWMAPVRPPDQQLLRRGLGEQDGVRPPS